MRDAEGKVNTVRYEQINTMLLNEFLKEHRSVETQEQKLRAQEVINAELKSTIARAKSHGSCDGTAIRSTNPAGSGAG